MDIEVKDVYYTNSLEDLHDKKATCKAKQLISNFEAENKETPQQLEREPKNGVACKIKKV